MANPLIKTKIKGTSITAPTKETENHAIVLGQLREVVEIAQRLRGDPLDSFVRVSELNRITGSILVAGTIQPGTAFVPVYGTCAVAALPIGALKGARGSVNDALAPVFGNAVAGGGAIFTPVIWDGAVWRVG